MGVCYTVYDGATTRPAMRAQEPPSPHAAPRLDPMAWCSFQGWASRRLLLSPLQNPEPPREGAWLSSRKERNLIDRGRPG